MRVNMSIEWGAYAGIDAVIDANAVATPFASDTDSAIRYCIVAYC